MSLLPNRSRNLSLLFRVLGHLGVTRVDVRFDERGGVDRVTVVTGSLQSTVSERDLPPALCGSHLLLEDASGKTYVADLAKTVVAAARSADGDDAGATIALDIRGHEITRTSPITFIAPEVLLGTGT